MHSSSIISIFALAASLVSAAPSALQARSYPTVATIEADLTEVPADWLAQVATVVVNLDEDVEAKREIEARQGGTCTLRG